MLHFEGIDLPLNKTLQPSQVETGRVADDEGSIVVDGVEVAFSEVIVGEVVETEDKASAALMLEEAWDEHDGVGAAG